MSNNIRQYTFYLKNSNKNLIYADIYNNKKTYKLDMSNLNNDISKNNLIPIKKYEAANNSNSKINNEEIVNKITKKDKLFIKNKMDLLMKNEYFKIFNFIEESNVKYTENQNGIFVNLNDVDDNTLYKIKEYIETITENRDINQSLIMDNSYTSNLDHSNDIKLSNYEKSIIKKNNYLIEQKTFKNETNVNNWFYKQ